jgi:hypothetical protein
MQEAKSPGRAPARLAYEPDQRTMIATLAGGP